MKRFYLLCCTLAAALCACALLACDDGLRDVEYTYPDPDTPTEPEPPVDGYPEGLSVTEFTHTLSSGKQCRGFVAIADLKANPKLRFNAVHLPKPKKPTAIHRDFAGGGKGEPIVTTNAGYWYAGNSLSLLISDGVVQSIENQTVTRKDASGKDVTVYPVRASFGQQADASFETTWIYCVLDKNDAPYSFPSALDNDEQTKTWMPAPPTSATPGAKPWTPREAVGGGPMLVKDGMNVAQENYWKEAFDGGGIAGLSRQPRTAIGATADGKLILLVCDGRNMRGSAGFTLAELADKMISYGAVNAINLDGGGSSTFVGKDGTVLNRPSDTGEKETLVERSISTAVVISLTE